MQHLNKALRYALLTGLLLPATHALADDDNGAAKLKDKKTQQVKIDCNDEPWALKTALEKKVWASEKIKLVISGECLGPIVIDHHGVEIDGGAAASLRVKSAQAAKSAILLQSATASLSGFYIDVPAGVAAVTAKANSTASINRLSTNAKADSDAAFGQFVANDSSSLYLSNLTGNQVLVIGGSAADFTTGNTQLTLNVMDTSTARSSAANQFKSIEVSGNGYVLADNKTQIDLLMIWSKAAVDINNESKVAQLMMGGQTLFAAYRNSSISGPYALYGNVVFELESSTATNWVAVDKPHSIISGNNATVNGTQYPGWTWTGQAGNQP